MKAGKDPKFVLIGVGSICFGGSTIGDLNGEVNDSKNRQNPPKPPNHQVLNILLPRIEKDIQKSF